MRSLLPSPDTLCGTIFDKPLHPVAYEESSHVVRSRYFPAHAHRCQFTIEQYGYDRKSFPYEQGASIPPPQEMFIHELRDVILYNGILCTPDGGYFPESARSYSRRGYIKRLNGDPHDVYGVGGIGAGRFPINDNGCQKTRLEGKHLWFHVHHIIYGHELLETIPQLWAAPYLDGETFLLNSAYGNIPQYLLDFVKPFGISRDSLAIAPQFARIEQLTVVYRPIRFRLWYDEAARQVFETIREYYLANTAPEGGAHSPDKIYLTRRNVRRRKLRNEEAVEAFFMENGFHIVDTEHVGIPERIRMFSRARYLAGPMGSGMLNEVFFKKQTELKILHLVPPYSAAKHVGSEAACIYGRPYSVVYGKKYDSMDKNGSWEIDMDELRQVLQQFMA